MACHCYPPVIITTTRRLPRPLLLPCVRVCVCDSAGASASAVTAHRLLLPDLHRLLTCSRTPAAHRAGYL
jgi:hypothetical protein